MKKALAMALGGLMVAGSAAPAMAASSVDFSGYYRTYFMNDVNLGAQAKDGLTDSYFAHRLNIDMTFTPTDEIAVYWRLRAPTFQRWGTGSESIGQSGGLNMETRYIYGKIKQNWGTVLIGRLAEDLDVYGLASLGYQPGGEWSNVGPFDGDKDIDAIRISNEWDNGFGLMAQFNRVDAGRDHGGVQSNPTNVAGSDYALPDATDRYTLEGTYKWDGGGASLGVIYEIAGGDPRVVTPPVAGLVDGQKTNSSWFVNPAIMQSWGAFSTHFEGMAGWGEHSADGYGFYLDADYNYGPGNVTFAGWWNSGSDVKNSDGIAPADFRADNGGMVSIDQGNFYPLMVAYNTSSAGWGTVGYEFGATATAPTKAPNMIELANNANEYFVQVGLEKANFLNSGGAVATLNMAGLSANFKPGDNDGSSNHWAIALTGNHAFTDDISMNYAAAYLGMVEPTYKVVQSGTAATLLAAGGTATLANGYEGVTFREQDKELGFELDLGFTFKLLDNLDFNTSFGYMFTGDAYQTLKGYNTNTTVAGGIPAGVDTITAEWEDADDTYVWYNTLTFSF